MFAYKDSPNPASLPIHPAAQHEFAERDSTAYVWFWVLLVVACLIFVLIIIRMWLHHRQRHESGCPCRKCKSKLHRKDSAPTDTNATPMRPGSRRMPPHALPSIEEDEVLVPASSAQADSADAPQKSKRPRDIGFTFSFDHSDSLDEKTSRNSSLQRSGRRNSLPANLSSLLSQTRIGFGELFSSKKEPNFETTPV